MAGKLGATLVALVFGLPFGAVGAFATYGIATMFGQSHRAGDWVLVQAKVDDAALKASRGSKGGTTFQADGAYRYSVGGREFVSTQLGFLPFGGSDNVGDWQESMAAFLEEAKTTGKSIPVYVNPDNPSEAVVDRDVRWAMVLFMGLFAVLFGGVGIGALVALGAIWFAKDKPRRGKRKGKRGAIAEHVAQRNRAAVADAAAGAGRPANDGPIESSAGGGVKGLWIFTILWNLIALPIALLAVPEIVASGEWLGLLVLIFPLLGILMLWGCISQTIGLLRRGKATLVLNDNAPRMGGRLSGEVRYPKTVAAGREFEMRLIAVQAMRGESSSVVPRYFRDATVRPVPDPRGGTRLPFQFDVPSRVKAPGMDPGDEPYALRWSIQVKPRGASMPSDEFEVTLQRAAEPVADLPLPEPTPEERRNDAAIAKLFGPQLSARLTADQRAAFAQMPPQAQQLAAKVVTNAGTIRKAVVGLVIAFVVLQVLWALGTFFLAS